MQGIQYCGLLDMPVLVFPEVHWKLLAPCFVAMQMYYAGCLSNLSAAVTESVSIMMKAPACCIFLAQLLPTSPAKLTCCPARWRRLTRASTSLPPW